MKPIYLFIFILAFSGFVSAQNLVNPLESTPYIEVTGDGEMEVIPDEIYLQFTLKERYDGKTKIQLEDLEKKLKQLLRKDNFNLEDLSLANANADFISIKRKKKDVLASMDYVMKVSTTSELVGVWNILDQVDAQNAFVRRVHHSRMEELKKEVKIKAIKNGKDKAEYLLGAVGEKIGSVLSIQERETYEPVYSTRTKMMSNMVNLENQDAEQQEPEISFQKIKLNYKVFIRFAID